MTACRFCDHENPLGAARCQSCGGPLPADDDATGVASRESPVTGDSTSQEDQLLDLLRRGRKIEAIKVYRAQHGAGLKEAKDAVESLAAQHNIAQRSSGCMSVILLAVVSIWCLI